ncbi:MAG: aspartate aminotransferase family protein [Chloroflexota bacterium]
MKLTDRQQQLLKRTFLDYMPTSAFLENPLIVERADRLYYWDTAGKRYFDAIGGIFVAVLGHGHPRIMEAMRRQLETMSFAPPLHSISDVALAFNEKLSSITPGDLNFIKAFSGGSESVESALKFARQYFKQSGHPSKFKFVSRYEGYHGGTFGAMAASGTGKRKTPFEPQMSGFVKVFPPSVYRDRFDTWAECNRFCAQMFEDVIVNEDPETVAGVILEPIGNTGGTITPTDEYFHILRDICDRHNVLLIFDEIITGFGRTGNMFAAQTFGVTPDIICGGKGLSSGAIPLGAMMAREDMGDVFLGPAEADVHFAHGHTFAANPLAAAVGIAVIDELVEQNLPQKAFETGNYLAEQLEGLARHGVVREVRGKGMFRGVELMHPTTGKPFPALGKALKKTALNNGLIMRIDPNWFSLAPALIAEKADIDELMDLIERSLLEALEHVNE